jgi:hypothetical protein
VKRVIARGLAAVFLVPLLASGVLAQPSVPEQPPAPEPVETAVVDEAAPAPTLLPQADGPTAPTAFVVDVAHDYVRFFSIETALWLGTGTGAALGLHAADEAIRDEAQGEGGPSSGLKGGQEYGALFVHIPLAIGWWIAGHAAGSARGAATGRDLLRAQISAVSWTYALKYTFDRTRPNGEPRSFPSGHVSAAFATAMVLEEHYGWKLGVPAFAAAAYTAVSRVTDNKHWASDVMFGAFLGMASARTVTLWMRRPELSVTPLVVPGGGGLLFQVTR